MFAFEQGVDVEAKRQLDRFASGARRRDDDDASRGWFGSDKRLVIGRKAPVLNSSQNGVRRHF